MLFKISTTAIGVAAGCLGAYGAFEYAYSLEHQVNYVVLAAVLIAILAASLPYFGERSWRMGMRTKSILLWVGFAICAANVFYGAAERFGIAKAAPAAERQAARDAVPLAETALIEAKATAVIAEADARAARKLPLAPVGKKAKAGSWCDKGCLAKHEANVTTAHGRVADVTAALTRARAKSTNEGGIMKQPAWLLPLAIDYGAFVICWFAGALLAFRAPVKAKAKRTSRKAKAPSKPRKAKAVKNAAVSAAAIRAAQVGLRVVR
jgi:hypothetical protein